MRASIIGLIVFSLALPLAAFGAGLAGNDNFRVIADDQAIADETLAHAELYRQQIALEWLGETLPEGQGRVIIGVEITDQEDVGITWPIDGPGRKFHRIWIASSRAGAVGTTLRHEMVHAVFATRFDRGALPPFAEEAAASFSDDPARAARRQRNVASFARSGQWPRVERVLTANSIAPTDEAAYSAACSLAEYLLTLADKPTFVGFAIVGKQAGWDTALQRCYRISSVAQLQSRWQAFCSARFSWLRGADSAQPAKAGTTKPISGSHRAVAQIPSR